jgi:hypothetical protein
LGTLLSSALQQASLVRDALERGARTGRSRLDELRSDRRRHDALAELGALVLDLIRAGEIDLAELPEARALVDELDAFESSSSDAEDEETLASISHSARPPRSRFDARSSPSSARSFPAFSRPSDGTVSSGARPRPPAPAAAAPPAPRRGGGIRFDDDEDLAGYMHPDDVPPKPPRDS